MTIVYMKTYMHAAECERIFAIMRHKNNGMAQIQHMISLLKEAASLMPDYPAFESICTECLRQAWDSDRLTGKRELHNRRRAWMCLSRQSCGRTAPMSTSA